MASVAIPSAITKYYLFMLVGNKSVQLLRDVAANGVRILSKHSSNARKVYEIVRWFTLQ